ncbi:hypothetical protein ACJMK2_043823 [Sinanodonta woodiana]|uniref:Uncharacterized protein n=1 Tax=Sinanodonta woodiana TaxID=1069815 RepID=A0ABD3W1P2_SINWO
MGLLMNMLFLALCLFTENIRCDDSGPDYEDNSDNGVGLRGGDSHEHDDEHPERHGDGKMIIVIPVVGVLVLIILVTCGICILKKYNQKKIRTRNYQEKGEIEKHQLSFPVIVSDNPPPYTPKMEEGEMKPAPMDFLGYGTGWYAPTIVSMPPPYTKVVNQSFHPDSSAPPEY